jgi:tyrosine-protein kinase Etk/Wzc
VAQGGGAYRLQSKEGSIWDGRAGQPLLADTGRGDVRLLVDRIDAAPGARFTLQRHERQAVIANVQRNLTVAELGKQSGVIELRLKGDDPARVRDLLNGIGQEYLHRNTERATGQAQQSLAVLERQLPAVKGALEKAEADFHAFRLKNGTVNLDEEARMAVTQSAAARTKRFDIEQKRNEALTRLGENHPVIAGLNRQLADIDAEVRSARAPVRALPLLEQEELRLTRDVKVNTDQYAVLSSAIQQLRIMALGRTPNVELVDAAVLPDRPVKPNRTLLVFGAAVAGLMLGMVTALLRHALRTGIHSVDKLESTLGARVVLAAIPHSEEQARLVRGSRKGSIPLLATAAPDDPAIEALRGLRAALQFALPRFQNNIVMITGPTAGLGKSFVSANVAALIAASGRKTLLIDMDLRNGELHRYFGVEQSKGLYEAVMRAPGAEHGIRYDVLENLDFVPTGACTAGTGELLIQRDFDSWLSSVSAHYDMVVMDAPPVLAVADAAIVGARAGAVLLVARAGVTTEHQVGEAVRRLNQAGISPEGILFNDARLPRLAPEYQYKSLRTGRLGWHA